MQFFRAESTAKRQYLFLITAFSLGLGANLIWCNVIGHSIGFTSSAYEFSRFVNVRIFWLAGISLSCLLLVLFPGNLRRLDKSLKYMLPILASSGTGIFAIASSQAVFDPMTLTIIGLMLAGMIYVWTSAKYNLLIVRVLGVKAVALSTAGALSIMLIASIVTPLIPSTGMLVLLAMLLPVLAAVLFEVARRALMNSDFNGANDENISTGDSAKTVFGIKPKARVFSESSLDKTSHYVFLIAVALILAMARCLGTYGVWQGTEISATASFVIGVPGVLIIMVLLLGFTYCTVLRMEKQPIGIRFIPPIIVLFAGLFVAVVQIGSTNFSSQIYNHSLLAADVCSHLLFWCVVGTSMDRLAVPSFRVVGIAGSLYGVSSIVWVFLLGNTNLVDYSFVAITTYGLLAIALFGVWLLLRQSGRIVVRQAAGAAESEPEKSSVNLTEEQPTETLVQRCERLGCEFKLSPRERDVLILLAQGRTRKFIADELVLSDNTVKTHLTHIYAKMHISTRQQMLSLLWGDTSHPSPKVGDDC